MLERWIDGGIAVMLSVGMLMILAALAAAYF